MISLKLYGREYCGLCLVMRDSLQQQASAKGFDFEWIDIEDIEELEEKYGEWVPVLTSADDVEICHYHLDQAALDAYLANFR
jgi:thiol-disulfide isomerase/thioredoxin